MAALGLLVTMALSAFISIHGAADTPALAPGNAPSATKKAAKPAGAVTEIRIDKSDHTLKLFAGSTVVKTYKVAIGSGGMGPKQYQGDKVTPTGTYTVTSRFNGLYHQFMNVSYPNEQDRKRFAELKKKGLVPAGRSIGSSIGIHGVGQKSWNGAHKASDWTHGCIALDDAEIDEVAKLAKDGTKIVITD